MKKKRPELYTEAELHAVEAHIAAQFGSHGMVLHETVSPDIHVDIYVIDPTPERNNYILVTVGMGAHRMNVPRKLRAQKLERAELLVCLPPDWEVHSYQDRRWFWPIGEMKSIARVPVVCNTWLGHGHSVDNFQGVSAPYADNTQLCGMLLSVPMLFGDTSFVCGLPGGDMVNFYQLLPLYREEMEFKKAHDATDLLLQLRIAFEPLNPARPNLVAE